MGVTAELSQFVSGLTIDTTPTDVVTGDRADYVVETGIVTVTGSVKMTRENNQLNGGYAVVNLNTGISRMYPAPPGDRKSVV